MRNSIANFEVTQIHQKNVGEAVELTLTLAGKPFKNWGDCLKCKEVITKGKTLDIAIGQHRQKRSLDANAYLWALCQEMARYLDKSKEQVYIDMLGDYGVWDNLLVKAEALCELEGRPYRVVKEIGRMTIEGEEWVQVQAYLGSSEYDTKEMSDLINGIVNECHEMGIDTRPAEEIKAMMEDWERERKHYAK